MKKLILYTLFLVILLTSVNAHENQIFQIGDKTYQFTVGSLNEPVYVDDRTGVDVRIRQIVNDSLVPVEGLDLQVQILAGDTDKTFNLDPAYGDPGAYRAIFYPTVATSYIYRVIGDINDVAIELSFHCNPSGHVAMEPSTVEVPISEGVTRLEQRGTFGCPRPRGELSFPESTQSLVALSNTTQGTQPIVWLALIIAAFSLILSIIAVRR